MSEATIQKMVIEAQKHAIETLKLEPNEKSLKIELLIKKYINLDFMSKATTGTFWKKASKIQKEKYKAALLKQITLTIEEHLNTLATLSYIPINSEKRGKKLIYVKGLIRDPNKRKSDVNILWKLAANKNGSFLILDLEIEGVSLVSSQKAEAVSILRKNRGNFDILLNKMTRDN
tara:strand:+ start:504 stop:1028 length:525 start_codon:yes stop_codon:yes gene_type:complete